MKNIDEMEAVFRGAFKRARAELGVESFGMQVIDMPANYENYPEHDHTHDNQEEVFLVMRGGGEIEIEGERFPLDDNHVARVGPRPNARSGRGRRESAWSSSAASPASPTRLRTSPSWASPTRWRRARRPSLRLRGCFDAFRSQRRSWQRWRSPPRRWRAPPAPPAEAEGAIVVVSGDVTVARGETVDGVFVASGDARIAGEVAGDVIVLSGDVLVSGRIDGDLFTAGGDARLLPSAEVTGDVGYGDEHPRVALDARVHGDVTKQDWPDVGGVFAGIGDFVIWLAVTLSLLVFGALLLLIAPRAADALEARSRERLGPTIAIGIAILIVLPVARLHRRDHPHRPAPGDRHRARPAAARGRRLPRLRLRAGAADGGAAPPPHALLPGRARRPPRRRLRPHPRHHRRHRRPLFGLGLIGAAIGAAREPSDPGPARTPGS